MKTLSTLLIASVVFLSACSSGNISQPEFRDMGAVRVIETGVLKTTVGADMIYYNPNNTGIKLTSARGDVYFDNVFLGTFALNQEVQVNRQSEFVLPVTLSIDNISALTRHAEIIKKKEVLVRVEGRAYVKKAGFEREMPIRYEQMQDVAKLRTIVVR